MTSLDPGALRRLFSAPMLVALLALVVATGGTTYAALAVTGKDVVNGTLTTKDVKNGSLLKKDFKAGQVPVGPAGPVGPDGPPGAAGAKGQPGDKGASGQDGSPDTPEQVLAKLTQVDGPGSNVDADNLDGMTSADFVQGRGGRTTFAVGVGQFGEALLFNDRTYVALTCGGPASNSTVWIGNLSETDANLFIDNGGTTPIHEVFNGMGLTTVPALAAGEMLMVHMQWADGVVATFTISTLNRANDCHFQASGVLL